MTAGGDQPWRGRGYLLFWLERPYAAIGELFLTIQVDLPSNSKSNLVLIHMQPTGS
jgi:hypothetical protein